MTEWQRIGRWSARAALALILLAAAAYASDWAVWRLHLAHGIGTSSVQVTRMVVAPLKGNREEYYMDGMVDQDCSRSLFPQGGNPACWWLARHRIVYDR